jgi:hypothetical protein
VAHAQYWYRDGTPVLLLGASDEDNLFQMERVEEHLDLLADAGGNYVRNTMSSRDRGNLWPFRKNEEGFYNLNNWSEGYWLRLDHFLEALRKQGHHRSA